MAGGIDWFRWHHGSVTDPKFGLIAKKAGVRVGDVIAVWAMVLESASANEERGVMGQVDAEAIEFLLGMEDGMAYKILDAMTQRGLLGVGGRVESWEKRQPKREREGDNSTDRSRAFRERQRQEQQCNATKRQETPRGEKSREENSPSLRSGESAEAAPPSLQEKATKTKTLKTYLADCKAAGTKPVPEDHSVRTWATEAGITPEMLQIAWVQFRERYTEGEKGKGKRYKDWPAHFATAVKANWFKLWFAGDAGMQWSSVGMTHKAVLDARMAHKEAEHA